MAYIGSTPTTQSFVAGTDYFNGTGSQVAFTLSRSVNSVNDIEVIVNNVEQIPSGYLVSGTTLTFSAAPSAGTSNVYVRYLSTTNLSLAIPAGTSASFNTVTATSLTATSLTATDLTVTNGASIQGLTVGRGAGAVASNTAVGYQAGLANTTGANNTAIGEQALRGNTTAASNTAVGSKAGYNITTGPYNTVVGYFAGYALTTGAGNTFVGSFQSGGTAGAGSAVTTGSKNTILGGYTGNGSGLDIRTLSNHVVISDGDGNLRIHVNSVGQTFIKGIDLAFGGVAPSVFRNTNSSCSGFHFTAPGAFPVNGDGNLNDNVMPLGGGSNRMSVIFAGTGTISTSDENEKQDIEALSDAEIRVAVAIKGLIKKFRWKDAVATKGEDARIHVGVIAQEVQTAFDAENLDAKKYALFCSDTWHEFNGSSMDANGNRYTAETEGAVERTRLGVRYDQLLAFLIAAL